jgi:hypothetical protein
MSTTSPSHIPVKSCKRTIAATGAESPAKTELLQLARDDAMELLRSAPNLRSPEHQILRKALRTQIGDGLELAQIG